MPVDVRVDITDATIITALNTPGGAVYEWRNDTEREVLLEAVATSPVNDPLNARHRTSPPPGDFKRSWVTRRQGNQHRVGFSIENFSDHAIYVEEGRRASTKVQQFSWTEWGGAIGVVGRPFGTGTYSRPGRHVLRDAVNVVLERQTGGAYTPLI